VTLRWHTWSISGNALHDLKDSSGRIFARLRQNYLGAWELWDWRGGSLQERRVDTYTDLQRAKREGSITMAISAGEQPK